MPKLGLGNASSSSSLVTPGIPTSGLKLRYDNSTRETEFVTDGAAYFVSGDRITVSDSSDFTFTAGNAFSVGCWFKPNPIGTDHLIGKTNNTSDSHANNEWYFHLASGGKLCLQCFDPSESAIIGRKYNTSLSSNVWYYGLATYDGGTTDHSVRIYLNGERVDDSNQNAGSGFASMDNTATDLTFARTANGSVNYQGYMCNAAIWNRRLIEPEIKSIMWKQYADLSTSEKVNLVSWWNLDNLTEFDSVGTDNGFVLDNNATLGSELITGFTNGSSYPFDTFTSSGRDISAAIETSGDWGGCASNAINVTAGEWYKCTFDLTYISGTDNLQVVIGNGPSGASGERSNDTFTSTNGANTVYFKITDTDSAAYLQIGTGEETDVINFSMSNISLKKINGNTGTLS